MVCVVQITGLKDVGKTALAERLIAEAKARGLRILAVKESHHVPDVPDKDSYRMRGAGADYVLLHGGGLWALCSSALPDVPLEVDVAIVEGFKGFKLGYKVHIGPEPPADADEALSLEEALGRARGILAKAKCGIGAGELLRALRAAAAAKR
ncbi:MAG: molybdopterin-guanine dinucleotide biosynthesis protein B [Thermoproteus sp. AZ2]|uniref:Molybdopterin-guanine dinucleotide biosynthesis protein B n=1 Tax=Thermoproteus sp. AZ2 TaxID=1609232 RepID=A0ACC6UZG5_9CREN